MPSRYSGIPGKLFLHPEYNVRTQRDRKANFEKVDESTDKDRENEMKARN